MYVTAPVEDAGHYRNRHHSYSINVQAIVDHNLVVRDIHIGEVGSMHDARVFRRSPVYEDLLVNNNERRLSPDGAYTLTDFVSIIEVSNCDFWMIPCAIVVLNFTTFQMTIPFENNGHLTEAQLNFNRRLSQCRVRVENAFGRAKGKWRRLKFLHAFNQAYVIDYITAAFTLNNFTVMHGEPLFNVSTSMHG